MAGLFVRITESSLRTSCCRLDWSQSIGRAWVSSCFLWYTATTTPCFCECMQISQTLIGCFLPGRIYVFFGNKTSTQFLNFSSSVTSQDTLNTHILSAALELLVPGFHKTTFDPQVVIGLACKFHLRYCFTFIEQHHYNYLASSDINWYRIRHDEFTAPLKTFPPCSGVQNCHPSVRLLFWIQNMLCDLYYTGTMASVFFF